MRFFFPDAHELVDPGYDFARRHDPPRGVGQQDGRYAHELLDPAPYDGILLSRGVIQGKGSDADGRFRDAKYKLSEQQRLYRVGAREFFRAGGRPLLFVGDCGAFSYRAEPEPPYTVDGVVGFYEACRVDWGVSVDHVILGYDHRLDSRTPGGEVPADWRRRQEITMTLAGEFIRRARAGRHAFEPVGAAQGWSPGSYAVCVADLQKMGYRRVALGGMVALKSAEVLRVLAGVSEVRRPETELHLLGLNRLDHVAAFRRFGVTSFDSTSPLTQAFKDDRDNYYTPGRTYSAVRVRIADPKVTPELRRLMAAGGLTQTDALRLEGEAWAAVLGYAARRVPLEDAVAAVLRYERPFGGHPANAARYRETLADRPWETCGCAVCAALGVHCVLFRGAERNRRRGFHNLSVTHRELRKALAAGGEAA
ncbi:MAG: hypothetical protein K2X82_10315 [Gemmataceae bacterium]|nr:hypothetical protein [Gemmataceae bacterium]